MNWQLLLLMHTGLAACTSLQKRGLMRQANAGSAPLAVNALSLVGLYVCGLCFIPLLGQVDLSSAWQFSGPLVLAALLFSLSGVCNFVSFAHLETATASILGTCSTLFSVALAWLILGEKLTLLQIAGVAVLLAAVMYIMTLGQSRGGTAHDSRQLRGLLFGLGAASLYGLALVVEKYSVSNVPVSTYLTFSWGAQVICAVALVCMRPAQLKVLRNRKVLTSAAALGLTGAAAGMLFLLAQVRSDNLSLVASLANARIVLVALLAAWLFRERSQFKRRLGGALVAIIGMSLMMWH